MWVGRLTCSPADALRARPAICGLWVVRTFGKPGKPRVDDRTVISGILHVLKTGCRWRDVPPAFGPPTTIYNRYNRWSQRRIWQRIFEKMAAAGPVPDELSIDSRHVKAHRSAAGSKRGSSRKRLAVRAAEERAKSMLWPMIAADRSRLR
jgi:transposase